LSALAPAKVNLVLEVTGTRADGFHDIDSVLQTLELADRVDLDLDAEPGVSVGGPFAEGTPADQTNLAWRAAAGLAIACGESTARLHIHLEKQIPPAGGLGGGASDAAAALRLLQRAWPAATDAMLLDVANGVGSDEAFFLAGGTARARGRGEAVTPLPPLGRHGVVLFVPPVALERKTARMFAALDRHPFDTGAVSEAFVGREPGCVTSAGVFNAFERVAFDLFGDLAALWEQLERRIGEPVRLAGAGPTLFWIGSDARAASVAAAATGLACTVIQTATTGR
jgi:4-diphosphocytidyl-2-C-methyl-D-erythritol kinase